MSAVEEAEKTGSAEDLAAAEAEADPGDQLTIPGTGTGLTLNAGGTKPQSSEMKFVGGSLPVTGEFKKGDTLRAYVEFDITDVSFSDKREGRAVTSTVRRHTARLSAIEVVPAEPPVE